MDLKFWTVLFDGSLIKALRGIRSEIKALQPVDSEDIRWEPSANGVKAYFAEPTVGGSEISDDELEQQNSPPYEYDGNFAFHLTEHDTLDVTGGILHIGENYFRILGHTIDLTSASFNSDGFGYICLKEQDMGEHEYLVGYYLMPYLNASRIAPLGHVIRNVVSDDSGGYTITYSAKCYEVDTASLPDYHAPFYMYFDAGSAQYTNIVNISDGKAFRNGEQVFVSGGTVIMGDSSSYVCLTADWSDETGWGDFSYNLRETLTDVGALDYPLGYVSFAGANMHIENFKPPYAWFIKTDSCD